MSDTQKNDHPKKDLKSLEERLEVYIDRRSGLQFESLARFAGPLFDLYELDWRSVNPSAGVRDRNELAIMVAVLDTARLLWSFFLLEDETGLQVLPELEDALLGRHAGEDDRRNVLMLLSVLEDHWQQFSPTDRALAEDTPGFSLPSFRTLIDEYTNILDSSQIESRDRFGLENLEFPEALALFAQPLLEDPSLENDPDAFAVQIARAQAYWDLATTPADEYQAALHRILEAFADSPNEKMAIQAEAHRMVARYQDLFYD